MTTSSDNVAPPHIVFLDRETLPATVTVRKPDFPHRWQEHPRTAPDDVVARAQNADIVITTQVPLRADTLAQLPELNLIPVGTTGTDVLYLGACRERGITVRNIRGYAPPTVPENTFALPLLIIRP